MTWPHARAGCLGGGWIAPTMAFAAQQAYNSIDEMGQDGQVSGFIKCRRLETSLWPLAYDPQRGVETRQVDRQTRWASQVVASTLDQDGRAASKTSRRVAVPSRCQGSTRPGSRCRIITLPRPHCCPAPAKGHDPGRAASISIRSDPSTVSWPRVCPISFYGRAMILISS